MNMYAQRVWIPLDRCLYLSGDLSGDRLSLPI